MIPKRIYYCWFGGGEMSDLNKMCIESWHKECPGYEIIEINESNFDYNMTPYSKVAYEHGNWSYVSNTARLYYLNTYGGFYLDTDVELIKPLHKLCQYNNGFITEFEPGQPDSGVLGCAAGSCDVYKEAFERLLPGTVLHKEFIQILNRDYDIHGESVATYPNGFAVLNEEWFPTSRISLVTRNTIGVHYFENTWMKQWRSVTDGFNPYQKMDIYMGGYMIHSEKDADIIMDMKNPKLNWDTEMVRGRANHFFNPRVVKLKCAEFDAERKEYDRNAELEITVTPSNMVVYTLKGVQHGIKSEENEG